MIEISKIKKKYGIEILNKESIDFWSSIFEKNLIGGLISYEDGRLNTIQLLEAFMRILEKIKVKKIEDNVIEISRNSNSINKKWKIHLERNSSINQDYVIICSGLNTQKLLKSLGHTICLEAILGQVIDLQIDKETISWNNWPAVLNYQSINFISHNYNHLIMGATIENGNEASLLHKQEMLSIHNTAPEWLKKAKVINEWSGIRARPLNEPSPLLKELEPGLLINTGHYRNGILLAPSCAEWIGLRIKAQ